MEVMVNQSEKATIITVKGELDMYNSRHLKEAVQKLWEKDIVPIIFNLKDLIYVDSSGISLFLYFYDQMTKRKQPFYFVNLRSSIQKVIKLTGIEGLLPIEDSVDSALSSII
jgi:anti-anti-sigma factor